MAAKAVSDPVLELAEGLLHEVQWVLLPRDVPAPPALARAPAQGCRARPGRAAPRSLDSLGEDLGDSWHISHEVAPPYLGGRGGG